MDYRLRPWLFAALGAVAGLLFLLVVGRLLVPADVSVPGADSASARAGAAGARSVQDPCRLVPTTDGADHNRLSHFGERSGTAVQTGGLPVPSDRALTTVRRPSRAGRDPATDPQNAASRLREAFDLWKALDAKGDPPLRKRFYDLFDQLQKAWQGDAPLPPNAVVEIQALLRDPDVQKVLDLLAEAARQPRCDFGLDYSKLFAMPLPHLASMRDMARLLTAAGWGELQTANRAAGLTRFRDALTLAEFAGSDPTIVSHLVGIAVNTMTLTALSTSDLANLGQDAETRVALEATTSRLRSAQVQSRQRLLESLAGEQEMGEATMRKAMADPEYARKLSADMGNNLLSLEQASLTPASLARELAAYRQVMASVTAIATLPAAEGQAALEKLGGLDTQIPVDCPFTRAVVPALVPLLQKQWHAEALLASAVKMLEAVPRGEGTGGNGQH